MNSQRDERCLCIVGIGGGTGSGKTTFAQGVQHNLGKHTTAVVAHDAYYRDLSHLPLGERAETNFDHPSALETELLVQHLHGFRRGERAEVPAYDFCTHSRLPDPVRVAPRPVVVVEGILALCDEELRSQLDLKVFVDAPADLRLARRMDRDVQQRGRRQESVLEQYFSSVRPMHEAFVEPSRKHADIVVLGDRSIQVALDLVCAHVRAESEIGR